MVAPSNKRFLLESDKGAPNGLATLDPFGLIPEAQLRAAGTEIVARPLWYAGLDPTGATDSSTALQAWLDSIPNGGTGRLPAGTYQAGNLTVTGKAVTLNTHGATLVQILNRVVLQVKGAWDATVSVSASTVETRQVNSLFRKQTKLTFAAPQAWRAGDVIRVFSDDVIPGARPGSGGNESRAGEFATVFEVSGNDVYLSGPLRDTFTTNVRAARLQNIPVALNGLRMETPDAGMASWTSTLLDLDGLIRPRIDGFRVRQGAGQGIVLHGCVAYEIRGLAVMKLNNDGEVAQYGYAINDNSCEGGFVDSPLVLNVRHGFTDDTQRIAAGNTNPSNYGRSRNAVINEGRAFGTSGASWDTHHCGEGHLFIGCRSVGGEAAHNLRGRKHMVVDSIAVNCRTGYNIMTESSAAFSYEHRIVNSITEGALYEAISVSNLQRDGRLTVTVSGGRHQSEGTGMRATRTWVRLTNNVEFVSRAGQMSSGTALVEQTDSLVEVIGGAVLDLSPSTAGTSLAFGRLADATSAFKGRGVTFIAGAATARMEGGFVGVAGALGTVNVTDYSIDDAAALTLLNLSTGSAASNARPSSSPVYIAGTDMRALGGSPANGWVGAAGDDRIPVNLLDGAATEDVGTVVSLPPEVKKVDIALDWTNAGAGTGDVRWTLNYGLAGAGDSTANKTAVSATATAPVQGIQSSSVIASGVSVTAGKRLIVRVRRVGGDALDTLANDVGLIGVLITPVA